MIVEEWMGGGEMNGWWKNGWRDGWMVVRWMIGG